MLNRDTWSKPIVKELIKKFFIFWQINKESEAGKLYCAFYAPTKMPHIAVLDPVTRQKMINWNGFTSFSLLLRDLNNFLANNTLENYDNHNSINITDVENMDKKKIKRMGSNTSHLDAKKKQKTNKMPNPKAKMM